MNLILCDQGWRLARMDWCDESTVSLSEASDLLQWWANLRLFCSVGKIFNPYQPIALGASISGKTRAPQNSSQNLDSMKAFDWLNFWLELRLDNLCLTWTNDTGYFQVLWIRYNHNQVPLLIDSRNLPIEDNQAQVPLTSIWMDPMFTLQF